ncbi:MAG: TAT-variant-translocated molybdopterin oxidoreductase, partial [Terracidiphilus sp.]
TAEFQAAVEREFPSSAQEWSTPSRAAAS